jgi:AraC-like DNA-binding protein
LIPLGEFSIHEFFRLKSKIQNVKDIQNFREVRSSESSKSRISNLNEDDVVERIRNLVEVEKIYLDESMSLGKLAKRLQIREDQTSYIINRKFKMTFYSLINSHRIEEAKKLLKKNEVNILNVAFSVGFQSKSAFNSIFKKYTKMTPSEFQKQVSMN